MASFRYIAISAKGVRVQGVLAAASEQAVLAELEGRQLTPVKIEVSRERAGVGKRVPIRHLADAYGQLADLLNAGVPLLRSLKLLGNFKSRPGVAAAFAKLAEGVERGVDLAGTMESHGGTFPKVHVAMVRAGERGGFLDQVMQRLAKLVTSQAELRAKVVGNLVYPAVLATVGAIVGVVLFTWLVPMFRTQLERTKGDLPAVTKLVFGISDLFSGYGVVVAIVVATLGVGAWRLSKKPAIQVRIDAMIPKLPVIGGLLRAIVAARVCGLLGSMLGNGVPLLMALSIAREGAGNRRMAWALGEAIERVRQGQALATPLAESGMLEPDVVEMIAVGEGANNLDEVLERIAASMEARVDRRLGIAVKLIEPLMLVCIASLVLLVAVALLLPMAQMSSRL